MPTIPCVANGYIVYVTGDITGEYSLPQHPTIPCRWYLELPNMMQEMAYRYPSMEFFSRTEYMLYMSVEKYPDDILDINFSCGHFMFWSVEKTQGLSCVDGQYFNKYTDGPVWELGNCSYPIKQSAISCIVSILNNQLWTPHAMSLDTRPASLLEDLTQPNAAKVIRCVNPIDKTNFKIKLTE